MKLILLSIMLSLHAFDCLGREYPQPVPVWLTWDYDESFLFLPPIAEEQDADPAAAIHYSRCESTDFEVPGGE